MSANMALMSSKVSAMTDNYVVEKEMFSIYLITSKYYPGPWKLNTAINTNETPVNNLIGMGRLIVIV